LETIGILVDRHVFRRIKSGKPGNEKLHLYNKAAVKHGLTPVYMCLERTDPSSGKALGFQFLNGKYVYKILPIPKVIHNRTLPASKRMRERLKQLAQKRFVFNAQNRYSKYLIHKLLQHRFAANLPVTTRYTRSELRRMMDRFRSLYIKPQSSSLGNGIVKITRNKNGTWIVQSPRTTFVTSKQKAETKVNDIVKHRKYVIQQTIPLAKYNGNPYDIRVTVQRGFGGNWQVTGMYCKVARKGRHVTNVARGGTAKKCDTVFRQHFQHPSRVAHSVRDVSLQITRYLGERLNRLADVGLDMGVDASGKPYFIEMNGRDQRYGFRKAKMPDTFRRTYETPILYAKYVLQTKRH